MPSARFPSPPGACSIASAAPRNMDEWSPQEMAAGNPSSITSIHGKLKRRIFPSNAIAEESPAGRRPFQRFQLLGTRRVWGVGISSQPSDVSSRIETPKAVAFVSVSVADLHSYSVASRPSVIDSRDSRQRIQL